MFISGGSEAIINEAGIGGFNAMHALSTRNDDPATASRPFDLDRDGFVAGFDHANSVQQPTISCANDQQFAAAFRYKSLSVGDGIGFIDPRILVEMLELWCQRQVRKLSGAFVSGQPGQVRCATRQQHGAARSVTSVSVGGPKTWEPLGRLRVHDPQLPPHHLTNRVK